MNVTELRQRLEDLEAKGDGQCRVEVAPVPPPLELINGGDLSGWDIDFVLEEYEVTDIIISPWQRSTAITLHFNQTELLESGNVGTDAPSVARVRSVGEVPAAG